MAYWLIKSEPFKYSFEQLLKDKRTTWDGVRNFQARNNLRAMKKGDALLFYHSNEGKAIIGLAEVIKEHYADPTATEGDWSVVDIKPLRALKNSVTLEDIKANSKLQNMAFVKQGRLSVSPVTPSEFSEIIKMSEL